MPRQSNGEVVERQRRLGTTYALRFRAGGERHYLTVGNSWDGYTRRQADLELANVLADVRRGIWKPPVAEVVPVQAEDPTFHVFASEWLESQRHELAPRTIEDYELQLTHHLLPFFAKHCLSQITAREVDRYKAAKVRERERGKVERPLSNRTINKTLIRLGQILDVAVRYELLEHNAVKAKVAKLKETEPRRARLTGEQVQAVLRAAGRHRALLATAIMAGGLRVSELTHLRWRDVDLRGGTLAVTASKTAAGVRAVTLEPELVQLLREHKVASRWSQPEDFVFAGRFRDQPRSATASARGSSTARSSGPTSSSPPPTGRRSPTGSPSTRSGARTRPSGRARRTPGDHRRADGSPRSADDAARLHRRHRPSAADPPQRPARRR